jgi:acetyl esterase/lipase
MRNRPDPRSRGFYLPQTASRSPGDRRRRSVALVLLALLATALALIIAAATSRVDTRGADVVRYSISSPLAHHTLAQVAVLPPGPPRERRGLLVFGGETAPGAFDDSSDFARNDVIAYARDSADPYAGTRLWLDVGAGDRFRGADTALASELRAHGRPVSFHVWPGGHEPGYWNSLWSSYIGFYAAALASCG